MANETSVIWAEKSPARRGVRPALIRAVAGKVARRDGVGINGRFRGYGLWFEADEVARCIAEGQVESAVMPLGESVAVCETLDRIRACLDRAG